MKLIRAKNSLFLFFLLLVGMFSYLTVSMSLILNYVVPFSLFIILNSILYFFVTFSLYKYKLLFYFDGWFVLFFPMYYMINSILYLYYDINVFSLDYSVFYFCFLLCFSAWILSFIILLVRPKLYDYNICHSIREHSKLIFNGRNYLILFILGGLCSLFFYQKIAGLGGSGVFNSSRLELVNKVDESGWYLKYFMISYAWYIAGVFIYSYKTNNKISKIFWLLIIPVLIYFYSLLIVGSRREIVFCLIFVALFLFFYNQGVFSNRLKLFSIFSTLAILLLGSLRYSEDQSQATLLLNTFGEFIFPINTLLYHFDLNVDMYKYGSTYFNSITNFIPKSIYPEKPLTLAVDFAMMLAIPGQEFVMGYAFTPISESFVNFGSFSIMLFPIILCFIVYVFEIIVIKYPLFLVLLLTQVVNFQRSDIASLIFELTLLAVCFIFCDYLTRVKIHVGNR